MKHKVIKTKQELDAYLSTTGELLVYDTETTGLEIDSLLLGVSYYDGISIPVFVPTDYFFTGCLSVSDIRKVNDKYMPSKKGIAHNVKFDIGQFRRNGFVYPKTHADTLAMAHIYNPDTETKLEKQVTLVFKKNKQTFEQIVGKKWPKIKWDDEILPILAEYACEDTYWEFQLYKHYNELLQESPALAKIHSNIEVPMAYVLERMYDRGVLINPDVLSDIGEKLNNRLTTLIDDIHEEAGVVFNINSGKQKQEILYDKLKLPVLKNTKGGQRSTDSAVLEELALMGYPIAEYMVEYSTLQKLDSGYVQSIPRFLDSTNTLRCNFNSSGTRTGRFSSDHPNLQNQPNNDDFPIRKSFVARPGYKFNNLDYSQIELRVMGHVSGDKRFLEAFRSGEDIHSRVARDLGIDRKGAKTVNFGVIYGMGYPKLALMLGIPEREAKDIIRGYETTYSGYYRWKTSTENFAKRYGYVKNIFGRIRRLPDAQSNNKYLYSSAMRKAVNTVVQGSAADIIKLAMIKIDEAYIREKLDSHLLLQVHDELLGEAHENIVCQAYDLTKSIMENTTILTVPLIADGKIISDWSEMKNDSIPSLYNNYRKDILPIWALHH